MKVLHFVTLSYNERINKILLGTKCQEKYIWVFFLLVWLSLNWWKMVAFFFFFTMFVLNRLYCLNLYKSYRFLTGRTTCIHWPLTQFDLCFLHSTLDCWLASQARLAPWSFLRYSEQLSASHLEHICGQRWGFTSHLLFSCWCSFGFLKYFILDGHIPLSLQK